MIPITRIELVELGMIDGEDVTMRLSTDIARFMGPKLAPLAQEEFWVASLNAKHRVRGLDMISRGSLTQSTVHPREVFKAAMLHNSAAIVVIHNHPSGDPTPSTEDQEITKRLRVVGELLGIRVLDHVIIAGAKHFSFTDAGYF